ncbi:hypothetical protein SAMN05428989_2480 [Pseudoxanthomonas sp. GM95]|uniref:hypothetical protein n=1 Tax=Pseudoxanthomonas sp. GM95 TaxID=1881043 RepID=UPI0008BBA6CE|nr:hypothetical protein [Pseudoxanthomonas sp. GM95]SEL77349.1 hypothetical protein SAMN05428989_2480 [Pseudoxanthomonas sp. GM95]
MRNKIIRGRLMLLSAGAIALVALVACGPDTVAPSAATPPAADEVAPAASAPATTSPAAPTQAPPAPADALEVPPAMSSAPEHSAEAHDDTAATPEAAEDTVRRYYAAVDAKDYATAYALWGHNGQASRQTFEGFVNGYAKTTSAQATVGKAFNAEGAAGSRYIQVPVDLASTRSDGSTRHYRGNFTLKAVMADGATPEQRQWHLDSADLEGYEPAPAKP